MLLGGLAGLAAALCCAAPAFAQEVRIGVERAFPRLDFRRPILLLQAHGDARMFVVEQAGRVLAFDDDPQVATAQVFVDIRGQVEDGPNEAGLLGMAFHPGFAANRQVFLSYTRRGTGRGLTSVISRFIADGSGAVLDSGSEQPILTLDQPFRNHNGGHIMFGPDGFLYIGFGDGGSRADPQGNGQNVNTLLGAILRIDVDGGRPYAIPPDNPFAGGGGRPEIYAWGLRNPWRFTFDRATGDLWLGDVGQNDIEEIDLIVRGGNYGWNLREGTAIFRRGGRTGGLIGPVGQYRHNLGCSITGGYVYDGGAVAGLGGAYVFGDFCSGRIWAQFAAEEGRPIRQLVDTDLSITSFGQANDGRLFVLDLRGAVFQLVGR